MAAITMLTMALTVHRRFARTATSAITPMLARRMDIGALVTSWTEYSLESDRGTDGDTVVDFTVADSAAADLVVVDLIAVVDSMVVEDSLGVGDSETGLALPTAAVADSAVVVADSTAVAAAFMAAEDSTEVAAVVSVAAEAADSMAAEVADSMAVAAGTAAATGN